MSQSKVRVLGGMWILLSILFGISLPFAADTSCAQIVNPAVVDQRWYILHIFGGSIFWVQNLIAALVIGVALIVSRFRPLVILLSSYFILVSLFIPALMILAPELFPSNILLFGGSLLIAGCGIATVSVLMKSRKIMAGASKL